ncbi:MAG: hypothetical protein J5J06_03465 [Phycisphaerae bacterium]|nr:hypothetical protein [Phycisphaerae bacterium]
MRKTVITSVALLSLIGVAGCPRMPGTDGNELTQKQREAVAATTRGIADTAGALAGASPTADADQGEPAQVGDCPSLSLDISNGSITLTLDYGDGCSPTFYPASTISGSVTGSLQLTTRTASLTFDQYTVDDRSLDGQLSGTIQRAVTTTNMNLSVDLAAGDGSSVDGSVMGELTRATGVLDVPTASLTVVSAGGDQFDATWSDLVIDFLGNGDARPQSGTAQVMLTDEDATPPMVTLDIEYTEQTPVDGTVIVSINDGAPFPYTP